MASTEKVVLLTVPGRRAHQTVGTARVDQLAEGQGDCGQQAASVVGSAGENG